MTALSFADSGDRFIFLLMPKDVGIHHSQGSLHNTSGHEYVSLIRAQCPAVPPNTFRTLLVDQEEQLSEPIVRSVRNSGCSYAVQT